MISIYFNKISWISIDLAPLQLTSSQSRWFPRSIHGRKVYPEVYPKYTPKWAQTVLEWGWAQKWARMRFVFVDICVYWVFFVDISWYLLVFVAWFLSIVVGICWYFWLFVDIFIDICLYLFIFVVICWFALVFIDICWYLLVFVCFVDICWYLLVFFYLLVFVVFYWYLLIFVDTQKWARMCPVVSWKSAPAECWFLSYLWYSCHVMSYLCHMYIILCHINDLFMSYLCHMYIVPNARYWTRICFLDVYEILVVRNNVQTNEQRQFVQKWWCDSCIDFVWCW